MLVLGFIFRALPHIFRAKSIQPSLQKMARTPMVVIVAMTTSVAHALLLRSVTVQAADAVAASVWTRSLKPWPGDTMSGGEEKCPDTSCSSPHPAAAAFIDYTSNRCVFPASRTLRNTKFADVVAVNDVWIFHDFHSTTAESPSNSLADCSLLVTKLLYRQLSCL